ncbi:MAG TPA: DUF368 domain-containing protein [Cyclobacteriaceae bacterium]
MNIRRRLLLFLKGVGMGSADVVPGVSGGTIAFITGIYDQLLNSIRSIDGSLIPLLLKWRLKDIWIRINGDFLVTLLMGILVSILTLSRVISFLLDNYPIQLWSFFFGLIIISSISIIKDIKKWNVWAVLLLIFGTVLAFFITTLVPSSTPDTLFFTFISGSVAICAMILPGISGSFILLILGKYQDIINAIKDFELVTILVFGGGCVIGILLFVRLLSYLINSFRDYTVAMLAGFMLGSLNKIWPWKVVKEYYVNSDGEQTPLVVENILPNQYLSQLNKDPQLISALLFGALGIMIVVIIEKIASAIVKYSNKKHEEVWTNR